MKPTSAALSVTQIVVVKIVFTMWQPERQIVELMIVNVTVHFVKLVVIALVKL